MGSIQVLVSADDEWTRLRSVIVGRAENSCFPSEPLHMIQRTMPDGHHDKFVKQARFPPELLAQTNKELDNLHRVLEAEGVQVYRPKEVDWHQVGGYTGAMPRDGLLTVGNTLIEAPYSWACRRDEISLAFGDILSELTQDGNAKIIRAPKIIGADTLYDGAAAEDAWAINNSRPAFDAADFMRLGRVLVGQFSNVTNQKGIDYLRACVPEGYTVEILEVDDPHAMHIDATILPLRQGLMVYNPGRVTEEAIRKIDILRDWEIYPYPFVPKWRDNPPLYMTSEWLCMNVLSISDDKVIIEENDVELAEWLRDKGIQPIPIPFQHVHSIGGSIHCATVDLVRRA